MHPERKEKMFRGNEMEGVLMRPELLLYIGIGICAADLLGIFIAAIVLHFRYKQLKQQLDKEYGKRRH